MKDANQFVDIVEYLATRVVITDGDRLCVNGKSILGVLHAMEFDELWCESEVDFSAAIRKFIV